MGGALIGDSDGIAEAFQLQNCSEPKEEVERLTFERFDGDASNEHEKGPQLKREMSL